MGNIRVVDEAGIFQSAVAMNAPSCFTATTQNVECGWCPLSRVQAGVAVRIRQLCAAPEIQARLRELGFCEDQVIRLVTNRTSFICQVCNARLALSEQLAATILVEQMQPAPVRV